MTGVIATIPRIQFLNALGHPLAGGKLYTYLAGTTTLVATYQDQDLTTKNENPIPLDSTGSCTIWLDPAKSYKFVLKNALGVTQPGWPVDNISGASSLISLEPTLGQYAKLSALAAAVGSLLIGFIQAGAGAVAWWIQDKLRERVSVTDFMSDDQRADAKAYTYTLDMTGAFTKAIAYLVGRGGGYLRVPLGGYRLDGKAGSDAFKDGILIPSTGGDTSTRNGIIIQGEGAGTILRGNSDTMMVVRNARLFSGVRDLQIDGNGKNAIFGYAGAPESIDQTTAFTSQSFQTVRDVFIENCTHHIMLQPGPTVADSDSGAFYHRFENVTTNVSGTYDVWFRPDPTGANNRTTRTTFENCKFLRGKDSIYIQAATEIDFVSCWWEMWTGTMLNYVPDSAHSANIRLIGGYGESSGAAVALVATAPEAVSLIGFAHNRPPTSSEYQMNRILPGSVNIAKVPDSPARLSFGYPGFVDVVADPDNTGQRVAEIQTNGVRRERYDSDGSKTFYGTAGNIKFDGDGATLRMTFGGANFLCAQTAGGYFAFRSNFYLLQDASANDMYSFNSAEFIPRTDNGKSLGNASFRWSQLFAGTGSINTSDEREKQQVQTIEDAALRAIRRVALVQFKFNDAVTEKGPDGARWHFGVIAQQVKAAFEAEGLDALKYGLLCYDEWPEEMGDVYDDEGKPTGEKTVVRAAGNRFGVRYDELICLRIQALEASLAK